MIQILMKKNQLVIVQNLLKLFSGEMLFYQNLVLLFLDCDNLTTISATDAPIITESNLNYLFVGCKSLEYASSLADWDVSDATEMARDF